LYRCFGFATLWLAGSGFGSAKICGFMDLDPRANYQPKTAEKLKSELLKKERLSKIIRKFFFW